MRHGDEKLGCGTTILDVPQKSEIDQNGAIVDFLWHIKKENKAEGTIKGYRYSLNHLLNKGVDLFNPESFKEMLAVSSWSETRKYFLAKAYQSFLNLRKSKGDYQYTNASDKKIPIYRQLNVFYSYLTALANKCYAFASLLKTLYPTS